MGLYEGLAAGGYGYGPAFRGLRAAWRRGDEVFAEVALPEESPAAGSFGLHPALLDAALHAAGHRRGPASRCGEVRLPFAWTGVRCSGGASALRVRLVQDAGGGVSLAAADAAGAPVVSVGSLVLAAGGGGAAGRQGTGLRDALFTVEWVPVGGGGAVPGRWAVVGPDCLGLAGRLAAAGVEVRGYPGIAGLAGAIEAGEAALTWC